MEVKKTMIDIKDVELFAAAVVQSSAPNLTVEEKLKLFLESKELATKHNNDLKKGTAANWLN